VSPRPGSPLEMPSTEYRLDEFDRVAFRTVDAQLNPYDRPQDYAEEVVAQRRQAQAAAAQATQEADGSTTTTASVGAPAPTGSHYGGDLFGEVQRYATLASEIARQEGFDVVHAHDWMTFPAGLSVAALKGVPLIVHVHSTEFDRSGAHVDQRIYDIERRGMHGAMKIIAVSYLTKNQIPPLRHRSHQSRSRLQRHRAKRQWLRRRKVQDS